MPNQIVTTSTSPATLGLSDFLKGLLLAVISAVLTVVATSLDAGSLTFNWKAIGLVAASTAVSYLIKNGFSAPQTTITPPPGTVAGSTVTIQIPEAGKKITESVAVAPPETKP
jgi:hypothetical protein